MNNQRKKRLVLAAIAVILAVYHETFNQYSIVRYRSLVLIFEGEFSLNFMNNKYVRRLMRFSKREIRLLAQYFALDIIQ